jgi:hypothetical protein
VTTNYDPFTWPDSIPVHGRRFVRAKSDPNEPEYDPSDDDTFFLGLSTAEMAAHYDLLQCACCGSESVRRTGCGNPFAFGTLTVASGALYGYALCPACCEIRKADADAFQERIDEAFAKAVERN